MSYYILKDGEVVPTDLVTWANYFESDERFLVSETINGQTVSTVFLGLDHGFSENNSPLVFETMIFGGPHDQYQERCSTLDEAQLMHGRALELVKPLLEASDGKAVEG